MSGEKRTEQRRRRADREVVVYKHSAIEETSTGIQQYKQN